MKGTGLAPLRDVQAWMVGTITLPSEGGRARVEEFITPGPRLTAGERLEIYRTGYTARLVECLVDDYPVLADTLGEDFDALGRAYVARYPSGSPNLNAFGRHMWSFCREADLPALHPLRTFASELAALEWALVEVLHSPTAQTLDIAALQAIPVEAWATCRFVPSQAVRLVRFEFPVNAYYQACREGENRPEIPAPCPSATAVYRKGLELWRMDLSKAAARLLESLLAGNRIGDALESLEAESDAEQKIMLWFREWVDAGLFAEIRSQ